MTTPLRQASLREHNLGVALRLVAEAVSPVSRAQIAATTGLTRATASTLAEALIAGGLLREVVLPPTSRSGRPAGGLVLAPGGPGGLGVEVSVDYVATTVVNLAGDVVFHQLRADEMRGRTPRAGLARVARAAVQALDAAARSGVTVCGLAVALPGLVDADQARLLVAPNLGWRDVDVAALLRREPRLAGLPLSLDNEANFAALGELASGGPDLPRSFVHVSGEVGIGAGIVLEGRIYKGSRGWGGEIGHITVDPAGPICRCGAHGCLELYAGQEAIARRAGLDDAGQPAMHVIVERAQAADQPTLAALDGVARALGTVLAGVVNLLDIGTIVLGGTYAPLSPWLTPGIERELRERVLWSPWAPTEVRAAAVGVEAAALGAARSVVADVLADPAAWLATPLVTRS